MDPESGALRELTHGSRTWFSAGRPLGRLRYEAFSSEDYDWLWERYSVNHAETEGWAQPDFLKPGLENVVPRSRHWPARLRRLSRLSAGEDARELDLLAEGDFGLTVQEARTFGAPGRWQVRYHFPADRPAVEITVQWFDKPAVRLAEALWLEAAPEGPQTGQRSWALIKLGREVDPADVVRHGNRRLHAAESVVLRDEGAWLRISNLDAPLVAPGGPALVRYRDTPPDLSTGPWFNLYNNTWGTNFPQWYEDDARFRFVIEVSG